LDPRIELFYWKDVDHREVDFVVKEELKVSRLIQVCWDMRDEKVKNRELRSLQKAMKELKVKDAIIITDSMEGEEDIGGDMVKVVPLWKWLLTGER